MKIMPAFVLFISVCFVYGKVTAEDDFVFIKAWPLTGSEGRSIYQMPLSVNGSDPTAADKIVQESDGISDVGFIYNFKTRSVLWTEGTEIKSHSIDGNSISILADVTGTFAVRDLGVDGLGNVYFTANDISGIGFISVIDSTGTQTELHKESSNTKTFSAISVDPIGQSVFGALQTTGSTNTDIKRLEGTSLSHIITATGTITSIAVDIYEQIVYYSDSTKIFYTNYSSPIGQNEFYQDVYTSAITDLDVAGDYVYFVGKNNPNVMKINKYDSTDVTRIGPDIVGINWLDVVLDSESVVLCDTTGIPHATVSADCASPMAGVSCDYTCDYGYEKNPLGATLTCGDNTGLWDLSTPCRAKDDFILVREQGNLASQRDVFMIPLNESGTTETIKVVDLADSATSFGVIFDGFRRSVIYSVGGVIKTLSIDGDAESTLADLTTGDFMFNQVTDLSLDTTSGDIYFAGSSGELHGEPQRKGSIGVINTENVVMALYNTTDTFRDMVTDPVNRFIFAAILITGGTTYNIVKMDFDGTNEAVLKANFQNLHCIAIDYVEQKVLWADVYNKIYKIGYDGSNEVEYYTASGSGKVISDMKVVGDYIYYIGGTSKKISKVHRLDASNETEFEPINGLQAMKFLDVPTEFGSPITGCSVEDLGNTTLPENCTQLNRSCNMSDIECGYGFKKNATIVYLICSASGVWNVQLPTLCNEIICSSGSIDNATDMCTAKVGETCDTLTCDYGFHRNPDVGSLNCTESGEWNYNHSSICLETICDLTIPNGNLSSTCGNRVGDTCGNFTCGYGYHKTDMVDSFNCTDLSDWSYNVSLLCIETQCNRSFPHGELSGSCDVGVGDSCNNFSCEYDYHENTEIELLNCTEDGTWDYNMTTLCIETLCDRSIPHGNLSDSCGINVGDTCDNFTCGYGFEEAGSVAAFNCSGSGLWNYDVAALCIETLCPTTFELGEVSNETCALTVGETCDNFTCLYGYRENRTFTPFDCTESGEWSYNLSSLCTEILCPTAIPNGNLSDSCRRKVGDSCNTFTCDYGYHEETGVEPFNCTDAGTWDYNLTTLCIETLCDRQISNGNLSDTCGIHVGDSCNVYTCDYGYNETEGALSFNCTEDGSWDFNVSSVCVEILCTSVDLVHGTLNDCSMKVGEPCDNVTCVRGYEQNATFDSPTCTESGEWNHNLSTLCVETICTNSIPHGTIDASCVDSRVDDSCDNFTCDSGYLKKGNVGQFNCTEDGTWDYDLSTLCTVSCPSNISNGELSDQCSTSVGSTCDNITCYQGFSRLDDIVSLVCLEDGTWALNISFLCSSTMASAINCQISPPADTTISGWIAALGSTCNYTICNNKYQQVSSTDSVICMSNTNWEIYDVVRCSASDCSGGHSIRQGFRDRLPWLWIALLCLVSRYFFN